VTGTIEAVCISVERGTPKKPVPEAVFVAGWGIEGDAHAGGWHRQVSILAAESIDEMKEKLPNIARGAFAENIITRGLDPAGIRVGDRLRIGEKVLVEITQIGKECHEGCAIRTITGDCIMPRLGLFTRVLEGGDVKPGDPVTTDTRS
jgi:MOSC domain-containing protein YiiM